MLSSSCSTTGNLPAMRIAILQSSYIPWKGYFDLIRSVDEFVLLDDVQYTRRDWRNRNRIKTPSGPIWLTIPVNSKGRYLEPIKDITISDETWPRKHWQTIKASYARAPHFARYADAFEELYSECTEHVRLSTINYKWISAICRVLNIQTRVSWSMDYMLAEGKTERLVSICTQAGADTYISGPAAHAYIDPLLFTSANI